MKELHARGCTDGNTITLRKDKYVAMSGTLMHEFTHYLNHFGENPKKSKSRGSRSRDRSHVYMVPILIWI